MIIHFKGAARTVTGSQYILELNGRKILLECGFYQGKRKDTYERNLNLAFDPTSLDAVVLSHAHLDHSGNLPNLVKCGYEGPIYATPATAKLADVMLRDSGHIQEADTEYANKRRFRHGEAPLEPIYTVADAANSVKCFHPVDYRNAFEPIPGITAQFVDAGHILGSAAVVLDVREDGRKFRLWFSGDIGRMNLPLLHDPVLPEASDYLIMECTYGDKVHRTPEEAYQEFREAILRTFRRGGKVIVPSFAVGRTQEIVYELNRMVSEGAVPPVPVYVDSPLAYQATQVFRAFPQLFDEETNEFIRTGKHPALSFDQLHYTESVDESKAINEKKGPMIIIAASGMAESGRILHHLRNNIEDGRNTILIVSWQSPETLGRALADRADKVRIFGEYYQRKAEVVTIGGFSAHGDQPMLLNYARSSKAQLKKVFLVHGEERSEEPLMQKMKEAGFRDVFYPALNDRVEIS